MARSSARHVNHSAIAEDTARALEVISKVKQRLQAAGPAEATRLQTDLEKLEFVLSDPVFQQTLNSQNRVNSKIT